MEGTDRENEAKQMIDLLRNTADTERGKGGGSVCIWGGGVENRKKERGINLSRC